MLSASDDALKFGVNALATYRIARLVTQDSITANLREKAFQKFGEESLVSEWFRCSWCVSMWAAAGIVVADKVAPQQWPRVATVLALSAIAGATAQQLNTSLKKVELDAQRTLSAQFDFNQIVTNG